MRAGTSTPLNTLEDGRHGGQAGDSNLIGPKHKAHVTYDWTLIHFLADSF